MRRMGLPSPVPLDYHHLSHHGFEHILPPNQVSWDDLSLILQADGGHIFQGIPGPYGSRTMGSALLQMHKVCPRSARGSHNSRTPISPDKPLPQTARSCSPVFERQRRCRAPFLQGSADPTGLQLVP